MPSPASAPALKTVLAGRYGVVNFPVGAAIEAGSTAGNDSQILLKHFNSITAESVMKPDRIWPNAPGSTTQPAASPNFVPADVLLNFATNNNLQLRGHTLLWHQTTPTWMVSGDRAAVQQNLRNYITTVMQHFPTVYAWDVVNEVASDTPNAANPYRTDSPWYLAYSQAGADGRDYVVDAFMIAGEVRTQLARPQMRLMLNDYNTELPGKRANVIAILRDVINAGAPIDGVGHQLHLQIGADVAQVTAAFAAVEAVSSTLVNHVTELDVSIYQDPGTCFSARTIPPCLADLGANPPQSVLSAQALLYRALFNAFNRPSVTSVSLWGVADDHTWLNTFPVTRTNRPLLFDVAGNPKWAFWAVVDSSLSVP
ncbi:MAG: endo-1,4-beta-xylanase [Steroidobacteraceae bacterium]|nr:endo-1,4-beta-xylanase [Steroidobacteraceae bacterium]